MSSMITGVGMTTQLFDAERAQHESWGVPIFDLEALGCLDAPNHIAAGSTESFVTPSGQQLSMPSVARRAGIYG